MTTPGSAERNQPDRPSVKRAVAGRAIARGSRLGQRGGRDPLPKSLPATAARPGERSPRTVAANPAGHESVGMIQTDALTKQLGGRYRDLPNPGRRVGILLDASAQHAGRRGREALAVSAHTMCVPAQRVDALLELVGLDKTAARRRVGKYSLGMRQRLGFAHALLGDPEVLILDEPANGLDPEGMLWLRGLLRGFVDRGGTVLLSSHLLAEVEAVADRLVMIRSGRIVADSRRDELLAGAGTLVRAADPDRLGAALAAARLASAPAPGGG